LWFSTPDTVLTWVRIPTISIIETFFGLFDTKNMLFCHFSIDEGCFVILEPLVDFWQSFEMERLS
jgi:hypothetical protein